MEKIRSKSWVGNIYHKFEAVCQEVDEFVTKDTVKYVENQVQTVGANMKKLYSGVVHDFLIPMDDHVNREAQAVNGKPKYPVGTYTSTSTGSTQNPIKEQSCLDQYADNSSESHNASISTELDGVVASVGNECATATYKNSHKVFKENLTKEEALVDEESSTLEDRISSESSSDKDSKDTMCYSFSDDDKCFSDASSSQIILQGDVVMDALVDEESSTLEDRISSESSSDKDSKDTMCYSFSDDDDKCFSDASSSQIILQGDVVREEQPLAEGSSASKNDKMFDSSPDDINCISNVPSSQMVLQRNITREVQPVTDQSNSFGYMALSVPLEENHGNSIMAKLTLPISLHDTELGTFPEDERGCNRFSDAVESISDVSITQTNLQDNITSEDLLASKESTSARDKSLHQTPAFASDIPPTSPNGAGFGVSMTVHNSFLDNVTYVSEKSSTAGEFEDAPSTFQSSELVLSRVLENESMDVDTGISNLAESSSLSTSSIGNCTQEVESDFSISTGLSSSLSTPLLSAKNIVDVVPALSNAVSFTDFSDVNASSSHELVGNAGSIQNDLEWCPSPQLKVLICPAETGCMNDRSIDLLGMETIDLTDKGKLKESCVLVDKKLHNHVSFRPRKYKSYKELIQEAFASRKRLIKEYKQLAVLYADVDVETSRHVELSQFPSLPSPCLHSTESSMCNICESEWELL